MVQNNQEIGTGPLAGLFVRLHAPLTHSLARHCSLGSRAPLQCPALIPLLTRSLTPELVGASDYMS